MLSIMCTRVQKESPAFERGIRSSKLGTTWSREERYLTEEFYKDPNELGKIHIPRKYVAFCVICVLLESPQKLTYN